MSRTRASPLLLACTGAAALAQCTKPRTELVVTVRSDLAWGAGRELQSLVVTVRRGGPTGQERYRLANPLGGDPAQWRIPLSFGLYPAAAEDATPVWVEVLGCGAREGCAATSALVAQRAVVTYRVGETVGLDLWLASRCRAAGCDASQRCVRETGRCEAAERANDEVRALPGGAVPFEQDVNATPDAGVRDDITEDVGVDAADGEATASDAPRDAPPTCASPRTRCGAACVDPQTDAANCGACGRACRSGAACVAGACVEQQSCRTLGTPGCGLVEVTGGAFTMGTEFSCMGSPDRACGFNASPPQPDVRVGDFALDAYEVTVARFRVFWTARASALAAVRAQPIRYPDGTMIPWSAAAGPPLTTTEGVEYNWTETHGMREAHPMNGLDWWIAQEFCVWDGGRLPTEAEWEYAARGRTVPGEGLVPGRVYPWGDTSPSSTCDRARWNDGSCPGDNGARTRRVGSFAATGGLFDLAGNVWEWTADWFVRYAPLATDGGTPCWGGVSRQNPICTHSASGYRVARGGSWLGSDAASVATLRSTSRFIFAPTNRYDNLGFRCFRTR